MMGDIWNPAGSGNTRAVSFFCSHPLFLFQLKLRCGSPIIEISQRVENSCIYRPSPHCYTNHLCVLPHFSHLLWGPPLFTSTSIQFQLCTLRSWLLLIQDHCLQTIHHWWSHYRLRDLLILSFHSPARFHLYSAVVLNLTSTPPLHTLHRVTDGPHTTAVIAAVQY